MGSERDGAMAVRDGKAGYEKLASRWLSSLIAHRSVLNEECGVLDEAARIAGTIPLECRRIPYPEATADDPFYTLPNGAKPEPWVAKDNLVAFLSGKRAAQGRSVILCSHLDVVDAAPEWPGAFEPKREGPRLIGRGAADAKGSVVSMLLALKILSDAKVELAGPVELHLVIEEEVGGNGALALIRERPKADAVIVGEPTSLNVHPANRGALWWKLTTFGVATHMGRAHEGVNAIEKAAEAMRLFRELETRLLAESRDYPLFERYERPIQLNIGTFHAGVVPSMVAEKAVVEGGIGFLPNKTLSDMERALHGAVAQSEDAWLKAHYELDFSKVRNDAYEIPGDHPLPVTLSQCCRESGEAGEVFGWNVSCDARLYAKAGGMPTVVFGPGDIRQAHATGEYIEISEVTKAAEILARFLVSWCGVG